MTEEEAQYIPDHEDMSDIPDMNWDQTDKLQELAASFHAAQSEMSNLKKDASNPYFNSQYLSLAQLLTHVRETFNKHDLILIQEPVTSNGMVGCTTIVMHKNGTRLSFGPLLLPCKADPQSFGSGVAYARRYSLQSVTALAGEDDDGEGAMHRSAPTPPRSGITPPSSTTVPDMGMERNVKILSIGRKSDKHPFTIDTDRGEFGTYDKTVASELEICRSTGAVASFKWRKNPQFGTRMILSEAKRAEPFEPLDDPTQPGINE